MRQKEQKEQKDNLEGRHASSPDMTDDPNPQERVQRDPYEGISAQERRRLMRETQQLRLDPLPSQIRPRGRGNNSFRLQSTRQFSPPTPRRRSPSPQLPTTSSNLMEGLVTPGRLGPIVRSVPVLQPTGTQGWAPRVPFYDTEIEDWQRRPSTAAQPNAVTTALQAQQNDEVLDPVSALPGQSDSQDVVKAWLNNTTTDTEEPDASEDTEDNRTSEDHAKLTAFIRLPKIVQNQSFALRRYLATTTSPLETNTRPPFTLGLRAVTGDQVLMQTRRGRGRGQLLRPVAAETSNQQDDEQMEGAVGGAPRPVLETHGLPLYCEFASCCLNGYPHRHGDSPVHPPSSIMTGDFDGMNSPTRQRYFNRNNSDKSSDQDSPNQDP